MPTKMAGRVVRKRKRVYTVKQLAKELGVNPCTIHRLEARPLSPLLERYLKALGYQVAYYPRSKEQE